MNKPKLAFMLRTFVSLSLLALLLWLARENFAKIWQLLTSTNIAIFAWAFLIFTSTIVFTAARLKIILAAQDTFLSIKDLFCLSLIGYFFTNFMPTSVGGDLVKGYYISKRNNDKMVAYSSVFIDRVIGLFSFTIMASIALVIMRREIEHMFIVWAIILLLLSCVLFALSIFQKNLLNKIGRALGIARLLQTIKLDSAVKKTYRSLALYVNRKGLIFKTLILSMLAQFATFAAIFFLSKSLSAYLPFGKIFLVMPIVFVLCMLPVTMNGLGLREWSFVFFFSVNMGKAAAFSLSLLYLAMFLLASLVGGVIYLFWR